MLSSSFYLTPSSHVPPPPLHLLRLEPLTPTPSLSQRLIKIMGLEVEATELPSLAPIRTSTTRKVLDKMPWETTSSEEEGAECVTPKSEEHVLKPALVCPPAPRKPRPAKRKLRDPPARGYFPVPCDLLSVFVPLPPSSSSSKKIRVG
ncbi:hypothetical protein Cni_G22240 [Canna indica]|uniref:Uncharacterized protein n=1 Tax=Canna indica TaxID=4628 RepID=A0AAQ3QMG4_9LILI|nr:hypothetical protein Cni_G22240 [Canna indica]